jgi:hypothetical protein
MNQFTPQELQNILIMIRKSDIKGGESATVAALEQKIVNLIIELAKPKEPNA